MAQRVCIKTSRLTQQGFPMRNAAGGIGRVGGAGIGAQLERAVQIEYGVYIVTILRRNGAELLERQLIERRTK